MAINKKRRWSAWAEHKNVAALNHGTEDGHKALPHKLAVGMIAKDGRKIEIIKNVTYCLEKKKNHFNWLPVK